MSISHIKSQITPNVSIDIPQNREIDVPSSQAPEIPKSGSSIAAAVERHSPSLFSRSVVREPSAQIYGLKHLNKDALERIREAKSPEEARKSVGWWNRLLDWIAPRMLRSSAGDAAINIFNAIYNKHPADSLQQMRMMLKPTERHQVQLEKTDDGQVQLKVGNFIFNNTDISDDIDQGKMESAILYANTADILAKRNPPVDAEEELQELANSFAGENIFEKCEKIAKFVLSKTPKEKCFRSPTSLIKTPPPSADDSPPQVSYKLIIDGISCYTIPTSDRAAQISAAVSNVAIQSQAIMRATEDMRTHEHIILANVECMADDSLTREKIIEYLDNPICQAKNIIPTGKNKNGKDIYFIKNSEKHTFTARFKSPSDGTEVSFDFSDRNSSKGEFRSDTLKKALLSPDYSCLRDICERGHETPDDTLFVYVLTPLKEDIQQALEAIPQDDQAINTAKEFREQEWRLKKLQSAKRRLENASRHVRDKERKEELKANLNEYTEKILPKARDTHRKAKIAYELANNKSGILPETPKIAIQNAVNNADVLQKIKEIPVGNTTIGKLLYKTKL